MTTCPKCDTIKIERIPKKGFLCPNRLYFISCKCGYADNAIYSYYYSKARAREAWENYLKNHERK